MLINTIEDPMIEFAVRVIAHKFYHSSRLNNVPCVKIDMGYILVENDHSYDLAKLHPIQLVENLGVIRKVKDISCKFGSLIVCIFFYV